MARVDSAPCATSRRLLAIFSVPGTTYSPSNVLTITNTIAGFITDQTIRPVETPAARITTNSLLFANAPKPIKHPTNAAKGIYSYIRPGILAKQYISACGN